MEKEERQKPGAQVKLTEPVVSGASVDSRSSRSNASP